MSWYWGLLLAVVFVGLLLETARYSKRVRVPPPRPEVYGLGELVYCDDDDAPVLQSTRRIFCAEQECEIIMRGKPDFILRNPAGQLLVLELKSGEKKTVLPPGERLQLAAYLLMTEEEYGERPVAGYLKYLDDPGGPLRLANSDNLLRELDAALQGMTAIAHGRKKPAQYESGRCYNCWVEECKARNNPRRDRRKK